MTRDPIPGIRNPQHEIQPIQDFLEVMLYETIFSAIACVAWRFCRAGRRSGVAGKFAREARENERRSQSPLGFSALARLYYLARPTKTAMLRKLLAQHSVEHCCDIVSVVVQFYPWFKFYFLLFLGMVMNVDEFQTKENNI